MTLLETSWAVLEGDLLPVQRDRLGADETRERPRHVPLRVLERARQRPARARSGSGGTVVTPQERTALVVRVEQQYGREGLWCAPCRSTTPTQQLSVHRDRLVLRCEGCRRDLLVLPREQDVTWAVRARVRPPGRSPVAVRHPRWRG